MTDALLASTDVEEALSRVYVAGMAARAGYATAQMDFDRDGVDMQIRAGGSMRPSLDVQLKATINLGEPKNGAFQFPLKRRNYDLLREAAMVPRILVALDLPKDPTEWMSVSPAELTMRRCAYWADLLGFPETENKSTITISIYDANRFDVDALKVLMEKARKGAIS
ncbi:hypothetical protein ACVWZL_007051 [Bradyrhizobium sp. GM2.4]